MSFASEVAAALERFPRVRLADFPTPLHPLPRLSKALGRPIYMKRDDLAGPALGGNKTRKLEYLMAEAQERGARKIVTYGGLQSNHARLTAAAANRFGLETHLFYFEPRPARLTGNLLLNQILGAKMHFVPLGAEGKGGMTLAMTNRLVRLLALLRVGPHYFIPVGGHCWRGCLGYVRAALEIEEQARGLGVEQGWVIAAAGSGGTLAGLMVGLRGVGSRLRALGVDIGKLWKGFPASIARVANEMSRHLALNRHFHASDVPLIEARYAGRAYGVPSDAGNEAMRMMARLEGIVLDPIYTGKALAGMFDLAGRGELGRDEPLIFVHTGGAPALWAEIKTKDAAARSADADA
ncbi:MAG: D-cysteine desulfhydrase family protein [Chloroflexi bacterium]|nr:D-cysteine desulfhydrase family protein [Chloroflexota bacterium]